VLEAFTKFAMAAVAGAVYGISLLLLVSF